MFNEQANGQFSVNKKEAFCELVKKFPLNDSDNLKEYFENWDSHIRSIKPSITRGSLNNCHGDWYEWLIALTSWNCRQSNKIEEVALLVPNATRLDIHKLYISEVQTIVETIKENAKSAGVNFISSNPDFVVARVPKVEDRLLKLNEISVNDLEFLDNYYLNLIDKTRFEDITGFLSVKTSFRPDRRLQIAHEGSSIKAMHHYIANSLTPKSQAKLFYQAVSINATRADLKALRTLAPYSMALGDKKLEPAIDNVEKIDCISSAKKFFIETFS